MTDTEFLDYTVNVQTLTTDRPADYGLLPEDATAFGLVVDDFADARQIAANLSTRTTITIAARNVVRENLETALGFLFSKVESVPTVSDEKKLALGITLRKPAQPIQPQTVAPVVAGLKVNGKTIEGKLMQVDPDVRGKPSGCAGANIFSYIGTEPLPEDITKWTYQGLSTKTTFRLDFPVTVPALTKVWLTAAWISPRGASGPLADPVSTYLGGGIVSQAA